MAFCNFCSGLRNGRSLSPFLCLLFLKLLASLCHSQLIMQNYGGLFMTFQFRTQGALAMPLNRRAKSLRISVGGELQAVRSSGKEMSENLPCFLTKCRISAHAISFRKR